MSSTLLRHVLCFNSICVLICIRWSTCSVFVDKGYKFSEEEKSVGLKMGSGGEY